MLTNMDTHVAIACTWMGLIGSLAVGVSDIAGMGQTMPMPRYWNAPWLYFTGMSRRRIRWCMAGTLALPIAALGYFGVYAALRPAGLSIALLAVLPMAFFMLVGTAIHALITLLGDLADYSALQGPTPAASAVLDGFQRRALELFSLVTRPALVAYAIGSIVMSLVVALGESHYPEWVALLNPFALTLALRRAFVYLPSWPFGLIRPAVVHLVHAPLLAVTLLYLS